MVVQRGPWCLYNQLMCDHVPAIHLLGSCVQGRPKSGPEDKFRLAPVAPVLAAKLGSPVNTVSDCIGEEVAAAVAAAPNGSVRPSTSPLLLLVPRRVQECMCVVCLFACDLYA